MADRIESAFLYADRLSDLKLNSIDALDLQAGVFQSPRDSLRNLFIGRLIEVFESPLDDSKKQVFY